MQSRSYSMYRPENPIVREAYSMLAGIIHVESGEKELSSIVVTSTEPKVGKTSVATCLAITMATWGKKTVLIDADMRKLAEKKQKNIGSVNGVYQFLQGITSLEEVLCSTNVENLMYIPNGRVNGNPMGLLCSDGLNNLLERAEERFDYIVIDTPPLDSVSDAAIISSKADAVLLVAKMGNTKQDAIKRAKEQLEKDNSNLLGVVINEVGKKTYKRYFRAYKYFYNAGLSVTKWKKSNKVIESV